MGDDIETDRAELLRVRVRGSAVAHYVVAGHYLTLCGRVTEYRGRYHPLRDYCRRCTVEATRLGYVIRP